MKILFIAPRTYDSCSFYRSGGIAPDLKRKLGADIFMTSLEKDKFDWQKMMMYDLVMFQRPYSDTTLAMQIYLKKLGIPVWVDFDDFTLDVPISNNSYETLTRARSTILQIAALADVVSVTTPALKAAFATAITAINPEHPLDIRVIPNAFNNTFLGRRSLEKRTMNVMWRGSDSHTADLMAFGNALNLLMDTYKDWHFVYMGMLPWFLASPHGNTTYLPPTDPIYYFEKIAQVASPVIHVPLEDSLFNRCKSNIAFIEGAYCGSVVVAPDWEEWRKPGVLTYKSEDEYMSLISDVLEGRVNAREMTDLSWAYIKENLMLTDVNELRVELVKSLLS